MHQVGVTAKRGLKHQRQAGGKIESEQMKIALVAPDKFRGTASASEVARAMSEVLEGAGYRAKSFPMSDGGEGLLDIFEGVERSSLVTAANGKKITAQYKMKGGTAIIEMARVAGLALVGGAEGNDPMAATTKGVGELIKAAVFAGAKRVIVGCGGSATTDGGLGAVDALEPVIRLKGVELIAAADVDTLFRDAAREFSTQKGASSAQVALLTLRLEALEQQYRLRFGTDISLVRGGGAAGGLAGGLAAIGAKIVSGFEIAAEESGIYEEFPRASIVVTGEGFLDYQSFRGKVVGRIVEAAIERSIPYLVIVGDFDQEALSMCPDPSLVFSLVHETGAERAFNHTLDSVKETLASALRSRGTRRLQQPDGN